MIPASYIFLSCRLNGLLHPFLLGIITISTVKIENAWQGKFSLSPKQTQAIREPKPQYLRGLFVFLYSFRVFLEYHDFTSNPSIPVLPRKRLTEANLLSTSTNSSTSACLKHTQSESMRQTLTEGDFLIKQTKQKKEFLNSFANLHEWKRAIAYLLSDTKAQKQLLSSWSTDSSLNTSEQPRC